MLGNIIITNVREQTILLPERATFIVYPVMSNRGAVTYS